jgi:hypothetical protein
MKMNIRALIPQDFCRLLDVLIVTSRLIYPTNRVFEYLLPGLIFLSPEFTHDLVNIIAGQLETKIALR